MSDTIMAIDLGRYKSVVCIYQRATRNATFRTIQRQEKNLHRRSKELGYELKKLETPPLEAATPLPA